MKPSAGQNQDQVLIEKLQKIVLDNLQNEQFGVESLAEEIGISRSHLHRKLSLLKGQSISKFIRQIRLEEAMKMLQKNEGTASEIAYHVGFNSSSYFHKCFQEHYGFSPGDVKKGIYQKSTEEVTEPVESPERVKAEISNTETPPPKSGIRKPLLIALIVVIFLTGGLFTIFTNISQASANRPRSIAVLPLKHIKGSQEQEYLALGMLDGIIGALGQINAIRVISRTSTSRYKESSQLLPEIADELGVDAIIEGSVFGVGDSVRIQLQLISTLKEERQLWAREYHFDMANILLEQSEMVRNIAREIQLTLTPQEEQLLENSEAVNPEAHKAYLKGMFYWDKLTEEDLNTSMKYFELALEIDPDYALAYAGIAMVWVGRLQQGLVSYLEGGSEMKIANVKSKLKELDRDLPEIHYVLGVQKCWLEWEYQESEREFRQAIALNPNHSAARAYLSHVQNILHKPEEGMEQIDLALDMDPFNPLFQALYGMDMLYARQFDKAISLLTKTLERSPTDPVALSTLRTAYHMKKMYPEALEIWETSYAAKEDREAIEALMRGKLNGGYHGALKELAETLIERSKTQYVTPWQIATLYTRAGMTREAIIWLEKAYEAHDSNMPYIGVDPIFDILWEEPRFQELLKKMKLPLKKHPLAE